MYVHVKRIHMYSVCAYAESYVVPYVPYKLFYILFFKFEIYFLIQCILITVSPPSNPVGSPLFHFFLDLYLAVSPWKINKYLRNDNKIE